MTERTPEDYAALELARRRILARRDADQAGDGQQDQSEGDATKGAA